MIHSPLVLEPLFKIGPVPITAPVVTTWALMAVLGLAAAAASRRLALQAGTGQAMLELLVTAIQRQIADTMRTDPAPYLPLIGTLLIFLVLANVSSLLPGVEPPTAHLETAAALALIVFCATHYYGVRTRGWIGYLKNFAKPTLLMLPLNLLEEITRTFSLMVRLFGNIMSGVFVVGIVLSLAGLFVPIPLMALDMLTGIIQAYIFTVLAMVFIGGAIDATEKEQS